MIGSTPENSEITLPFSELKKKHEKFIISSRFNYVLTKQTVYLRSTTMTFETNIYTLNCNGNANHVTNAAVRSGKALV